MADVFRDERGTVIFPRLSGEEAEALRNGEMQNMHMATIKPGAIRGNHLHPSVDEYILCIGEGCAVYIVENGKTVNIEGDGKVLKIKKGQGHAIINNGNREGFVFCFYGAGSGDPIEQIPLKVI